MEAATRELGRAGATAPVWRRAVVGAVSLGLVAALGMTAEAAAAPPVAPAGETVRVLADGKVEVSVADGRGASGTVVLGLDRGRFTDIGVTAVVDGVTSRDVFEVEEFLLTGEGDFRAELRSKSVGRVLDVDSATVTQQAFPVLFILGLLARMGIRWLIRWYGKNQVKRAARTYLLKQVGSNKWRHIMDPKHNWASVGARNREQVAELMARAMAEGRHSPYKSDMSAEWKYGGKTIVVTYEKGAGRISNGWVRR